MLSVLMHACIIILLIICIRLHIKLQINKNYVGMDVLPKQPCDLDLGPYSRQEGVNSLKEKNT